jgi:hypothetical protein
MTAADRYPPASRRRRSRPAADGDTITIDRADMLKLVRAQSVILDVFRGWAGLEPDHARRAGLDGALDISDDVG